MNQRSAISAINASGALLVFPIDNKKEPASLWSHFYPRSKMKWEWDESGDNRVAELWHLKTALATTRKVIYTKWYRGRATYFSRQVFTCLLRSLNRSEGQWEGLSSTALKLLRVLETESPLSTKELKRQAGLKGKANERAYEKGLQELWARMLIVAFGEFDDGAFPSLAIGSTKVLYEDLWAEAFQMNPREADAELERKFDSKNLFYRFYLILKKKQETSQVSEQPSEKKAPRVIRFEDL